MRQIAAILILLGVFSARAATINASSGSSADVQTAVDSASAGDTVVIPAGSNLWTAGISWTTPANITLMGAGTSATGGGDQTVIVDNIASGTALMAFTVPSNGVFRLSGITVRSGTGSTKDGGTVRFSGLTTKVANNIRIDHCKFVATSTANYKIVILYSGVFGVMDNSILELTGTDAIYAYNGRTTTNETDGNYEWSQPTDFGGTNYFVVEDCVVNGTVGSGAYSSRVWDGFSAAKVIVRFCNVSQAVLSETHDTGHSADDRGSRSQEIYCNKVTSSLAFDPNFVAVRCGGGTALWWGNTWDNVYKNIYMTIVVRKNNDVYSIAATPDGWGYAGTQFNGTGSTWDGGTALGTSTVLGYPCLDQPGRGQGDLITGAHPNKVNNTTNTRYWPNQALEPIYAWNNSGDIVGGWGGSVDANYDEGDRLVRNRDYYLPASGVQTTASSPFNGQTNVGWGTLANRPTTCTAGVAYFATDQGSWNTSTTNYYGVQMNGADGVLYKATATDTWTLYYTPLTYPHPLRNEGGAAPETGPHRNPAGQAWRRR